MMKPISIILFVFLTGCSSSFELTSGHATAPPALDGTHAGWQGNLFDLKEPPLYVGVQEDSAFIYLCVESPDRDLSGAMMRRGLQVSFTPDGDGSRTFGFRFPLPEGSEMEFIGPDGEPMMRASSLIAEREYGVTVTLRSTGPSALFQCKVPRVPRTQQLGIGPITTGKLQIALEVPRVRSSSGREPREEMGEEVGTGPGGGMRGGPGRGGGHRGGGPGGPGGNGSDGTDTVTLNVKVGNYE